MEKGQIIEVRNNAGLLVATVEKTKDAQPMGVYKRTEIDDRKDAADFRLVQVRPFYIVWKNGDMQRVTERQLDKLQAKHSWANDF